MLGSSTEVCYFAYFASLAEYLAVSLKDGLLYQSTTYKPPYFALSHLPFLDSLLFLEPFVAPPTLDSFQFHIGQKRVD